MANILISVCANGNITYWHTISGKSIITIKEDPPSDLYALDISSNGNLLAVAGKDHTVKIYDDNIKSLVTTLKAADAVNEGHCNRIFSVKFTEDPNVLLSGGWDNCVYIWDIRVKKSFGLLYGPHICGDTIDKRGDMVLTGSYSNKDVLQLWSFSKRSLVCNIPWEGSVGAHEYGFLYSAMFEKHGAYIAAGGAGKNEAHFFKNGKGYEMMGKIMLDNTVTSIDFTKNRRTVALGCGNGLTYSFSFK